jgi:outer membrane immunogenic protein
MIMKKIFFALMLLCILGFSVHAQAPLAKGEKQLNAGLGLSGWGVPVYIGADFGIERNFTLGFEGSFRSYSDYWHNGYYNQTIIGILGNGNYHFNSIMNIPSKWDFYAGLNLGFFIWSSPSNYGGPNSSGLNLGVQVGGRYFFTNRFGINLEFGGGNEISGGKFGITYKLR